MGSVATTRGQKGLPDRIVNRVRFVIQLSDFIIFS